jgi:hypothetical protein
VTQPVSAAYAQDAWKLDRVTLNYGVVWNPFLPLNFYDADVYNFSIDAFNKGVRSQVMKNAPPGFSYPGDPGFEGNSGVKSHYKEFDPRVGFAWDVNGDGRTAVRAGAGLGHDYVHHYVHLNTSSVAPFRLTVNLPQVRASTIRGRVIRAGTRFRTCSTRTTRRSRSTVRSCRSRRI